MFEWLPYNGGYLDDVPAQPEERRAWLRTHLEPRLCRIAGSYRDKLIRFYGEAGRNIRYAEAFEVCEYGAPLDEVALRRLFPFFPSPSARSIV